jgi:hypothetical protein
VIIEVIIEVHADEWLKLKELGHDLLILINIWAYSWHIQIEIKLISKKHQQQILPCTNSERPLEF